jgi:hypothetical protein
MSGGSEITYNVALDLIISTDFIVAIEVRPVDGGMIIYGYESETSIRPVEVRGSIARLELPFIKPRIYIKFLKGLASYRLRVLDSGRSILVPSRNIAPDSYCRASVGDWPLQRLELPELP